MDIVTWILVGLVAGLLASFAMGGGYGLLRDILIGMVGAVVGSWLFRALHIVNPVHGLAGTIFVAFIGALLLLLLLRALRSRRVV